MTQGRFVAIIVVATFLGLVTVWQQVQTLQWGYQISDAESLKKQVSEEQKTLSLQLSQVKSPQQLLDLARKHQIILDYRRQVKTARGQMTPESSGKGNHHIAGLRER